MVRVKLLKVVSHSNDYYYDYNSIYVPEDITDWECITEDELKLLEKWSSDKNRVNDDKVIVISELDVKPKKIVSDYIKEIQEKNRIKEEKKKKRLETQEKKKKTLELKKQAEEKKLLKELQSKYKSEELVCQKS